MKKKDWFTLCNFCGVHQDSPLISYIIISYCKNKTWPLQKIWEIQENRRKVNFSMCMAPRNNCCYILVDLSSLHFCFIRKKQKQNCHCTGNAKICAFFFFSFSRKRFIAGLSKENRDSRVWGLAHHPKTPNSLKGFTKPFFFLNWRIIAL